MKAKKLFTGFAVLAMATLLLTACGGGDDKKDTSSSSKDKTEESTKESTKQSEKAVERVAGGDLQDGTYKLVEKNADDYGWKAEFTMTVKDGKITESDFDYLNDKGDRKSENDDYEKSMKDKGSKTGPKEFIPELNDEFVSAQNAGSVEVVTGATSTSDVFKNYAQQLVQAAQAGKTDTIEIDNGAELKDGTYTLTEKNDSNGYHVDFSIVVKDGKIAESKYDNVDADGKSKADDADYEKNMKAKANIGPKEYIETFNKELVKSGNPSEIEVVTGATHSFHSFQTYAMQLINAAEKGDTAPIEVDNIVTK